MPRFQNPQMLLVGIAIFLENDAEPCLRSLPG